MDNLPVAGCGLGAKTTWERTIHICKRCGHEVGETYYCSYECPLDGCTLGERASFLIVRRVRYTETVIEERYE